MSNKSSDGVKPLSGRSYANQSTLEVLENIIITSITTGTGSVFTNISISGGTINGVSIGQTLPGDAAFTSIDVGRADGTGGEVCFFGNTVGDYTCWRNTTGTWEIAGDLSVRDISNLGNIRITSNTISSSVTNTNINLAPNGTGIVNISSGMTLTTTNRNVSLTTTNGSYTLSSRIKSVSTTLNNTTSTSDGSIKFNTGSLVVTYNIISISTGSTVTITTTAAHNLTVGDRVTLAGTNSTPTINGVYVVQTVSLTTTFTISVSPAVTISGNVGTFTKRNDINLNPLDSVFVLVDTPMAFGSDSTAIIGTSGLDLTLTAGNDINLIPTNNINIPANKLLTFSDDLKNITSDGTYLILNSDSQVIINGDLTVNGTTTYVNTQVTQMQDPVLTLGGTSPPVAPDSFDRGIEYRYFSGTAKVGFFGRDTSTGLFTYIPDATNTGEVFSGAVGGVQFGSASVTSLDLNGGDITNTGIVNACNITCTNNMVITGTTSVTITSATLKLNGDATQITDSVFDVGTTAIADTKDKGFTFNYYDGSAKIGFVGWDNSEDCFKFLKDVTIVSDVVTAGTNGDVCLGDTTADNLTVTGVILGGYGPERFSVAGGGVANPTTTTGMTFITITSSGTVTGTLPPGVIDGFQKKIFLSSTVSGGVYRLSCPAGRLIDPGSGTTTAKTLVFETRGQAAYLVWDATESAYLFVNGGVCVE